MSIRIKAVFKRVDRPDAYVSHISNNLENFQKYVGGYIETVTLVPEIDCVPGIVVICDEEGLLKQKPYNCQYAGIDFVGDIIVIGCKGEEFCDVPIGWDLHKRMVNS